MDTPFGTAQLNPRRFYDTVVEVLVDRGCELVMGSPVEALLWEGRRAAGMVHAHERTIRLLKHYQESRGYTKS